MEKKQYVMPQMEVVELEVKTALLAGSGVTSDDIEYGGIDDGTRDVE